MNQVNTGEHNGLIFKVRSERSLPHSKVFFYSIIKINNRNTSIDQWHIKFRISSSPPPDVDKHDF